MALAALSLVSQSTLYQQPWELGMQIDMIWWACVIQKLLHEGQTLRHHIMFAQEV